MEVEFMGYKIAIVPCAVGYYAVILNRQGIAEAIIQPTHANRTILASRTYGFEQAKYAIAHAKLYIAQSEPGNK